MKNTIRFSVSTLLISLVTLSPAYGADHLQFNTIRQMGMGGIGIAQTFDAAALYTNPAGLSEAHSEFKLPLRVRADINDFTLAHLSDVQYLIANNSQLDKLHKIDSLENSYPFTIAAKAEVAPLSWIGKNIGFGLFTQGSVFAQLINPQSPQVTIQGLADVSPMLGYSNTISLWDTPVAIGATLRYITRARIIDPATGAFTVIKNSTDFVNDSNSFNMSTATLSGFGGDIGTLMPFAGGKLGVVLYNVGTNLNGTTPSGNSISETLPMYLGVGYDQKVDTSGIPLIGTMIGTFDTEADIKFEFNDMYKNIYLGLEKKIFYDAISLRAGLHQGCPTVGVGIDAWVFHAQYAYYTEEMGDKVGDNLQSYHAVELGFLF